MDFHLTPSSLTASWGIIVDVLAEVVDGAVEENRTGLRGRRIGERERSDG